MRTAFVKKLTELAQNDSRIMLLVGDLGFGVVADFARMLPEQFLNVGVAEQNMAGVATGLALSGRIVFTYSIANFPILRCLEQLRNDTCYHNANVVSVAVGGGFSYGSLGMTHHGTEDLAIMRSLPSMTVIAPGDPIETEAATAYSASGVGPVYLRLGRAGEPIVHERHISWSVGKAISVRSGKDITLISTGAMLATAVSVAETLEQHGVDAQVLSMHTVKPLDEGSVLSAARRTKIIFTLEEHSILGGLGGAVAEVLCESGIQGVCFRRIGLPSSFSKVVGDQDYQKEIHGIDCASVTKRIVDLLSRENRLQKKLEKGTTSWFLL